MSHCSSRFLSFGWVQLASIIYGLFCMGASCTLAFSGCKLHSVRMSDDEQKFPSQLAERFQVRLPDGLRDRIKAYAERNGRSMNAEIVRVLENEFPEPWAVDRRVAELLEM